MQNHNHLKQYNSYTFKCISISKYFLVPLYNPNLCFNCPLGDGVVSSQCALLTLLHEEISEGQHDCVAAVQVVSTHVMRARDGQTSSGNQFHHPPHLRFPVTIQLPETNKHLHHDILLECLKNGFHTLLIPFCFYKLCMCSCREQTSTNKPFETQHKSKK